MEDQTCRDCGFQDLWLENGLCSGCRTEVGQTNSVATSEIARLIEENRQRGVRRIRAARPVRS
jgi:hypothetical protein